LDLYNTRLSGTLPRGLCAPIMNIHGNTLSGNGSATLAGCGNLRVLDLSNNSLTVLPANLPLGLTHLFLGSNPIQATATELTGIVDGAPALAALDVAFLALPVDLMSTVVTKPDDCQLGLTAPPCTFVLQLYDKQGQLVKVGGLYTNLLLGVGGLRTRMDDLADGRYAAVVPPAWAPNATGPLTVRFYDGNAVSCHGLAQIVGALPTSSSR
jgi:hypothetical protein